MFSTAFLRFLVVGGIAAAVNVIARLVFNMVTSYQIAILLAFPVALTVAFVLNRLYVFDAPRERIGRQYVRFALVNFIALVPVWLVSVGLARWLFPLVGFKWHADTVAHVIGVLSPVAMSYTAHRYFSFAGARSPI